jgi:hypothetical protein
VAISYQLHNGRAVHALPLDLFLVAHQSPAQRGDEGAAVEVGRAGAVDQLRIRYYLEFRADDTLNLDPRHLELLADADHVGVRQAIERDEFGDGGVVALGDGAQCPPAATVWLPTLLPVPRRSLGARRASVGRRSWTGVPRPVSGRGSVAFVGATSGR